LKILELLMPETPEKAPGASADCPLAAPACGRLSHDENALSSRGAWHS